MFNPGEKWPNNMITRQPLFAFCLFFLLNSITGHTQPGSVYSNNSYLHNNYQFNFPNQSQQPTASLPIGIFNSTEFRTLVIFGGTAYLISRLDEGIDEEYALEREQFPLKLLGYYGEVGRLYDSAPAYYVLGGIAVGSIGFSIISGNSKPAQTVDLMLKALIINSATVFVLKTTFGRHRPYKNDGAYRFDLLRFSFNSSYMSFPSGHTSSIFAMMTVLAKQSGSMLVKLAAFSFAASVAFQRMLYRKHWASDIIAGALIGHIIGNIVVSKHRRSNKVMLSPYSDGRRFGVALNF